MTTTLLHAIEAYLATEELGKTIMPYETALAIFQLRSALSDNYEFYLNEEQKLLERFAARDEDGNIHVDPNTGVARAKDTDSERAYKNGQQDLRAVACAVEWTFRAHLPPPATLTPACLAALQPFLSFEAIQPPQQ